MIKELSNNFPKIVCFCGSSRFVALMACLMWESEKQGNIALGLHLLPENYPGVAKDHQAEAEGIAKKMDELHRRKIELADEIFVVNIDNYIGISTWNEIEYARKLGKPIKYAVTEPLTSKQISALPIEVQDHIFDRKSGASNSCEAMGMD